MELTLKFPCLLCLAWGTIDLAVDAVRRGARDFVQKPWDDDRLVATLRTHAQLFQALRHGKRLEAENRLIRGEGKVVFIASSPAMRPVVATYIPGGTD